MLRVSVVARAAAFAAGLAIAACGAAAADDYRVEAYKDTVAKNCRGLERQGRERRHELTLVNDELRQVEQIQSPIPGDITIAEFTQKRENIRN